MKAKKTVVRTYYKNHTQTFNASGSFQTFNVPSGVTSLSVDCVASRGASSSKSSGGNGGRVQCVLPVASGTTLYMMVGTIPSSATTASYNASDIRTNNAGVTNNTSLNSRLIVAGGGGSADSKSSYSGYNGGAGGGLTGGNGSAQSSDGIGHGGSQTAGGAAGRNASSGSFGIGGNGSGSGGAGWYGGGGGSSVLLYYGGGGGGSSYTDSSCTEVTHTQGYNNGAGYITISYVTIGTESDYDYYKDSITVKVIKKDDKYYA